MMLFFATMITGSMSWSLYLFYQSIQKESLRLLWLHKLKSNKEDSLLFIWNRPLIFLVDSFFKDPLIAWGFWLGLEIGFLFCLLFGFSWSSTCLGVFLGSLYPWVWRLSKKRRRLKTIRKELPSIMDLLALATTAGLDLMAAIERLVFYLPKSALVQELEKVLEDLKMGRSRKEALLAFKERVCLIEVSQFVSLLLQSIQLGSPAAQVLWANASQIRENRFRRAERLGVQASIKILFPLVFCILPACILLIFAPLGLHYLLQGWRGLL